HLCCNFRPTAPPALYTLSLHDALPISYRNRGLCGDGDARIADLEQAAAVAATGPSRLTRAQILLDLGAALRRHRRRVDARRPLRSEEHTSELQSRENLVCRLLLEKKKQ